MSITANKKLPAMIALWATLFLWGMHAPAGRYLAMHGVPIVGVMAVRLWIGSAFFWSFLLLTKKLNMSFLKGNFKKIFLLSLIGIYLNMFTFHYGMNYVPATLVLLLENLAPFVVILLLWIFDRKKPTLVEGLCQLTGFAGLVVIVLGKGGVSGEWDHFFLGIMLEVVAGVTWAIYSYFSGRWLNSIIFKDSKERFFPSLNFICVLLTISAVIATPQLATFSHVKLNMLDCSLILMIGVLQTGVAFMLWNYALGMLPISLVSTCFYMTVVFTCMNEMLFLDLHPNWILFLGSGLILFSAIKLVYAKPREELSSQELIAEAA